MNGIKKEMIDNIHIMVLSGALENNVKHIVNKCKCKMSTNLNGHGMFLLSILSTVYSTNRNSF